MLELTLKLAEILNGDVYDLADLAAVGKPESDSSLGAGWLREVRSAAEEALVSWLDAGYDIDDLARLAQGRMDEFLVSVTPIVLDELWGVFVELELFREDTSEYTGGMNTLAARVMQDVAERLALTLVDEVVTFVQGWERDLWAKWLDSEDGSTWERQLWPEGEVDEDGPEITWDTDENAWKAVSA